MRTDSEQTKKCQGFCQGFLSQLWIFRSILPTFGENRLYPKNTKISENRGFEWCRRTDLNCGPHPYQGCALPLSYGGIFLRGGQCHFKTQLAICYLAWDLYKKKRVESQMPRSLTSKEKPTVSQSKVKMDRRAASLRENLRKRKLQERARQKSS